MIDFSIIAAYVYKENNKVDEQIWRNYSDPSQLGLLEYNQRNTHTHLLGR